MKRELGSLVCIFIVVGVIFNGIVLVGDVQASYPFTPPLYAHSETTSIGGTSYYLLKTQSPDTAGTTITVSAASVGRVLFGMFVYPLTGITGLSYAYAWQVFYRAWVSDAGVKANCTVDIKILKSDNTVRTTVVQNASKSKGLTITETTLNANYTWSPGYTVVDQTDYLEIDYYVNVETAVSGKTASLKIDCNTLAAGQHTRVDILEYDVAVTACSASPASVAQGATVTISVTIYNNGTKDIKPVAYEGGVKVTVYYESELYEIERRWENLTVGQSKILTFYWDTGKPDSLGDIPLERSPYLVFAKASEVNGEGYYLNNRKDGGYVTITGHDVAVKSVSAIPTGVSAGRDVTITVVAENHGSYSETFDVSVYNISSAKSLYAHQETTSIGGTNYYQLKTTAADQTGTSLSASTASLGKVSFGMFVYPLTGVAVIPPASWAFSYRAWMSPAGPNGTVLVDILIRRAGGTVRETRASNVAVSSNLTTTQRTILTSYSWGDYCVVDQTDYLEIDYYLNVTKTGSGNGYLRIDDNSLASSLQTRIANFVVGGSAATKQTLTNLLPTTNAYWTAANVPSTWTGTWTDPQNVTSSNNQYAKTNTGGAQEVYGGFGFTTAEGIGTVTLKLEVKGDGNDYLNVTVSNNGGATWGANHTLIAPVTEANVTIDVTGDFAWTSSMLTNANFKVRIKYHGVSTANDIKVDLLQVIVKYIRILTFTWNTSGAASDSYTIRANASVVAGELHKVDNTIVDGKVNIPAVHDVALTSVVVYQAAAQEGDQIRITVEIENQGDFQETFSVKVYYDSTMIRGTTTYPNPQTTTLANRSNSGAAFPERTLTFYWNTTGVPVGYMYTIKANTTVLSGEIDTADNTYVDSTVRFTGLYINPSKRCAKLNYRFNLTLNVGEVSDLFAWGARVNWNASVLRAIKVYEGPFLKGRPEGTTFIGNIYPEGYMDLGCSIKGTYSGFTGSGVLAYLEFQVLAAGNSPLIVTENALQDSLLHYISHSGQNGLFKLKATDINGDGVVGIYDLASVAIKWGQMGTPGWIPEDVNKDGEIAIYDLAAVAKDYGKKYI